MHGRASRVLAARGESPAAFDRRCIPPRAALGVVHDGSNTPGIFPPRALPWATAASVQQGLGPTRGFHHGLLVLTLSGLVAWGSTVAAQGPLPARWASLAGVTPSSSADLVRVRRLLAEPAGWVRDAAAAAAARATPNGQESGADDGPPSASGGRRKTGAIVAMVVGVGLFGFFLTRGPEKIDEMIELRGERSEIADFTLFAGAVTLIGTGAVMLIAGS